MTTQLPQIEFQNVTISYGKEIALRDISLEIQEKTIFGIIGPANAGKTTFLKSINRTLEFEPSAKTVGTILVDGTDISSIKNVYSLRRRIGMVFPLPVGYIFGCLLVVVCSCHDKLLSTNFSDEASRKSRKAMEKTRQTLFF